MKRASLSLLAFLCLLFIQAASGQTAVTTMADIPSASCPKCILVEITPNGALIVQRSVGQEALTEPSETDELMLIGSPEPAAPCVTCSAQDTSSALPNGDMDRTRTGQGIGLVTTNLVGIPARKLSAGTHVGGNHLGDGGGTQFLASRIGGASSSALAT